MTALRLARVAGLPAVVSHTLAAIALAGGHPPLAVAVLACVALGTMYVAGALLNDAFDRDLDRVSHPERPIPAGLVRASAVFDLGFVLLAAGLVLVAALALATGAGAKPVVSAIALGSLIVFYDAKHHGNPRAPLLLGLCRAGIYTTAALLVRPDLCFAVVAGAGLVAGYQVIAAARERPGALLASIALVDALLVANAGRLELAAGSLAACGLTLALQAWLPAA